MTDSPIYVLALQQQKLINKKLESLVVGRTKALELERSKTEKLLHAIFLHTLFVN